MKRVVKNVIVVNPRQFEVIRKSVKKTDKHDAKTLAYFLSKDMLPEARMKTKENAQLHSLAGTRDRLGKQRTALINKIHNVLNGHGIKFRKETLSTEKALKSIWSYNWDAIVKVELEVKDSPPGVKGDTAGSVAKVVTLETGREIKAPLFINQGDKIRVNTETGEYVERC